jgi:ABC1 atypical kinase-like domain
VNEALASGQALRDSWAEAIYRFVYATNLRFCLYNADPHPGKYLFHDDGSVSFLDFGCVKRLQREQVDMIVAIGRACVRGDVLGTWRACGQMDRAQVLADGALGQRSPILHRLARVHDHGQCRAEHSVADRPTLRDQLLGVDGRGVLRARRPAYGAGQARPRVYAYTAPMFGDFMRRRHPRRPEDQ